MSTAYVVTPFPISPGWEEMSGVPVGTKEIYYAWEAERVTLDDYSTYGINGKGMTPSEALNDLIDHINRRNKTE